MATRYQRGNHKPSTEGQTIQWLQDTKGVITSRLLKDRQYNNHKLQDTQSGNHNPSTGEQTIQ